jgi:hypothetical protein
MKILVVLTASEAITVRRLIAAQVRDVHPEYGKLLRSAGRKIADALTRQTTPRSLVSHEDQDSLHGVQADKGPVRGDT